MEVSHRVLIVLNVLNRAQRLNGLNVLNGPQYSLAVERFERLERAAVAARRIEPLERAAVPDRVRVESIEGTM